MAFILANAKRAFLIPYALLLLDGTDHAMLSAVLLFYRMRHAQALRMEQWRTRLSSDLHEDVGGLLSGF